jgi:hypothetical protein
MESESGSVCGDEPGDLQLETPSSHWTPHWGWVIVAASFISCFLTLGINYSAGLYYAEWMRYFRTLSSVTSWTGSLQIGFLCLFGKRLLLHYRKITHYLLN